MRVIVLAPIVLTTQARELASSLSREMERGLFHRHTTELFISGKWAEAHTDLLRSWKLRQFLSIL